MDLDIVAKHHRVLIVLNTIIIHKRAANLSSKEFPTMDQEELSKSDDSMDQCHRKNNIKKIWRRAVSQRFHQPKFQLFL
jgi:hypothetical protein